MNTPATTNSKSECRPNPKEATSSERRSLNAPVDLRSDGSETGICNPTKGGEASSFAQKSYQTLKYSYDDLRLPK